MVSRATSQLTGTMFPFFRIIGDLIRSLACIDGLKPAGDTENALIMFFPLAFNPENPIGAGDDLNAATHAAEHADAPRSFHLSVAAGVSALAIDERPCGTDLQTGPAGHAGGLAEGGVHVGRDHGLSAPELHAQGMIGCQLAACPDTAAAKDASVVVHDEIFSRSIDRDLGVWVLVGPLVHAVTIGEGLEFTIAAHLTEHAVMVPFGKEHLKDELSLLNHLR